MSADKKRVCVVVILVFPVFFNLGPVRMDDHIGRNSHTLEITSVSSNIEHKRHRKIK